MKLQPWPIPYERKLKNLFTISISITCALLVTRECIDDPNKVPEIYNKATSCVWRDGAWLLMEDTETAILLSAPIINELPPAEAAA